MREGRDEEIQNFKAVFRNLHQDDTIIGDENVHLTKTIVSIVMQHKKLITMIFIVNKTKIHLCVFNSYISFSHLIVFPTQSTQTSKN